MFELYLFETEKNFDISKPRSDEYTIQINIKRCMTNQIEVTKSSWDWYPNTDITEIVNFIL